jgi:hypothetical protein
MEDVLREALKRHGYEVGEIEHEDDKVIEVWMGGLRHIVFMTSADESDDEFSLTLCRGRDSHGRPDVVICGVCPSPPGYGLWWNDPTVYPRLEGFHESTVMEESVTGDRVKTVIEEMVRLFAIS